MQTDYSGAPIYDRPFRGAPRPGSSYTGPSGASDPKTARQITARYASKCPACKQGVLPGAPVYWEPGRRAVHVTCPSVPS